MGRKTYSLSAVAIGATASLSFSSADGAEAFAQNSDSPMQAAGTQPIDSQAVETPADGIEIVPQETVFVSEEVVQPLPGEGDAAEIPESDIAATSLPELVSMIPQEDRMSEEMSCLAGAVYFESRGEPLAGQLAVAQVVINRAEDSRFPASYCGVVYQRAQFSFVKNGRMPRIRTHTRAWQRAKAIARIAHDGMWESPAGDAVFFHANYVRPKWSYRKQRLAQIDTHIFYR
ncbi:MAG: cell wall hydrolase [Erythrobacter sp.]|uniref:cell wall hydrolase n=1 Tax=Erythrobacter sp. TaxID=1042 RepID=UPI0032EE0F0D